MSGAQITIGPGRFSYSWIFKPKKNDDGTEKFSTAFLWPKTDKKTTRAVERAIQAAIENDANGKRKLKGKTKGIKLPLRDGDDKEGDGAYEGMYYFTANSTSQPFVVDKEKQDILDPREFKSGDFGYISVNFYAFGEKGNTGIAVGLNGVMKSKNGEALTGSGITAETAFEDIEIEDDEEEEVTRKPKKKKKKPAKYDEDGEGSEFF